MIYVEDASVKVGGQLLPGVYKSLEVVGSALVEEEDVEGSGVKPKQATGYEDAKINIELVLDDTGGETAMQKLARINSIFRAPSQAVPAVLDLVEAQAAARGVSRVIFKGLTSKNDNKRPGQITATLTFWEYIPMVISNRKASGSTGGGTLTDSYTSYLSDRGKTASSPMRDDRNTSTYKSFVAGRSPE